MSEPELQIRIEEKDFGGVWSNLARVSHSPFEFTIDFARVDYGQNPPQGKVVSRVNMSPLMVSQLIDALTTNWERYAERAMPKEVRDHDANDRDEPDEPGLADQE